MMNPLSNPSYLLPPLITLFATIILLVLVWQKSRRNFSSQLFCVLLVSLGAWSLLTFFMRSSPDVYHALPWEKALIVAGMPVFVVYYHFTLAYTNIKRGKWVIPTIYSLLLAFSVLVGATDLVIEGMSLESYGYAPVKGSLIFLTFAPMPLFVIGGAYNLLKAYKVSKSYEERNRLLYLSIATVFPLLGAGLDGFSPLPPVSTWSNLIFCVICSIAIQKYHLLDIHIVLRKSLVYLLTSAAVAIPYVGILFLVNQILKARTEPWWIHAIIILLVAIVLRPLYSWVQQLADRLFYRDRYDHLRALQRFSSQAQSIANLKELGSNMIQLVKGALRTSSACLLLPSPKNAGLAIISSIGLDEPPSGIVLRNSSPLVRWLELHGDTLSSKQLNIVPQLQSFSVREKNNLERMGAKLYVPIKTRQGQLSGLLVLGEKLSQEPYSGEDKRLLMTLGSQMAMALENARLYDLEKTARKELEKQDKQRTEFLHTVAHELKTPLTAIISSSEVLSEKSSIARSLKERLINNIRQSAWSMNRRVVELLDLAEIQIGEPRIEPQPLETGRTITDIASQLHILFKNKEQTLTLEIPDSLPKMNADRAKLEQVLFNLLSNANKFSPTGSDITLRVREADSTIIVEVEDSGPAVTEGEKNKLFDLYYRGEDADRRERFPGIGLGLAISKKLVELHQGKIWVESKPGKGNTFAFSLPILGRRTNGTG